MSLTLDTNIALRLYNADDPVHARVEHLVRQAIETRGELFVSPQVLYELRVVLTRPMLDNGYGFSAEQYDRVVRDLREAATFIPILPISSSDGSRFALGTKFWGSSRMTPAWWLGWRRMASTLC